MYYSEFNADCVAQQTQWGLGPDYVAGSFVWTAFDVRGETRIRLLRSCYESRAVGAAC